MKRRKVLNILWCSIAAALLLVPAGSAMADYMDKNMSSGKVRVFYKNPTAASCDAIVIAVGTAMSRSDYDTLAKTLIDYGYIVVIMDHNPGNMVKTDATKYRNCVLDIQANILGWLSSTNCDEIVLWIVGGHSAGGQAAQNAVAADSNLADAVFSIDPYDCSNTGTVTVPALYWGFDMTTCFVEEDKAAKAAYYGSSGPRALQRVDTYLIWCWCPGIAPKFFHCSFCDYHCPGCTNCAFTPQYFFDDVANSVDKFITAAFYGTWSKSNLEIDNPTTPIDLFVDSDQP